LLNRNAAAAAAAAADADGNGDAAAADADANADAAHRDWGYSVTAASFDELMGNLHVHALPRQGNGGFAVRQRSK